VPGFADHRQGEVTQFQGGVSRLLVGGDMEVEDTADLVLGHSSGARSVLFATAANVVDSPVTLEIVTEEATLYVRGDLTITVVRSMCFGPSTDRSAGFT
jgi:UDP-N-acetyl-2-amino-2-deoxyglucuronate dehydrogenase